MTSRRIVLTTLTVGQSQPVGDGQTDGRTHSAVQKPGSGPDRAADTVRLAFTLFESNDVKYPELNYSQCVKQLCREQDLRRADDDDDEEEAAAAVERLEKKYGSKPKKKDRVQDLIDIGYGYEEDSFIDNSEAYDEFVPASITTKLGGFYINSGLLHFRQASDADDVTTGEETPEATKKRKLNLGPYKPKKKKLCREDGALECTGGQRSWGLNETRPNDFKKKKRRKSAGALDVASMLRKFEREKAKRKRHVEQVTVEAAADAADAADAAGGGSSVLNDPILSLIGSTNDHALIQAANTVDFDVDLESLLRVSEAALTPKSLPQLVPEAQDLLQSPGSEVEPKPDSEPVQIHSKTGSTSHLPCVPLLEGIPAGLNEAIQKLTQAALTTDGESKVKFFSPETNSILLDIELQCRELGSQVRSRVYTHLASFLPCSRETLLKRVRRIFHSHTPPQVDDPVLRLKEAIGKVMPEQISCFQENFLVYKRLKTSGATEEEKERVGQEDRSTQERAANRGVPKKLFRWNQEVRERLAHVLKEKMELLKSEKKEVLEQEENLKIFLDNEVKPLWPKGWMQSRVLMSESRKIINLVTPSLFKKKTFRKKQSPDGRSPGVDLHHGDRGVDGGGALASLQSHRPFDLNVTDSSLVLLADQALAQETPQCRPSAQQWCAAVGVARLPPAAGPLGFPLSDSCQVVLPPFLEVAAFATRHVDAGEAQVLRADANITIQ